MLLYSTIHAIDDVVFFFQAEDGIRDYKVTGVQTCALPIFAPDSRRPERSRAAARSGLGSASEQPTSSRCWRSSARRNSDNAEPKILSHNREIGRASCRERV